MRAVATFVLALVVSACTDFANPTTVVDLRVLAVQVEPSEIILDADLSNPASPVVDPANNPPVRVTPLIADPAGAGRSLTYTISACPNDPFAAAPPSGGQGGGAFPSGGARTTVGSALCDENSPTTWVLTSGAVDAGTPVDVHPTIDQLTIAFMTDIFPDQFGNLHGGFDLGMPLTLDIKVDAGGGAEQIRAIKRVVYWAQHIDAAHMPNQTPLIDKLEVFYYRDEATFEPWDLPMPIPDQMPFFTIASNVRSIWIMPSRGTTEPFETTVIDPDTHRAVPFSVERETLRYRFFATAGTFAPAATSTEPNPAFEAKGPIRLESEYSPPTDTSTLPIDADTGLPEVTIWVVVRDDRGGESWQTRKLLLEP
jgi:hypothetical protein